MPGTPSSTARRLDVSSSGLRLAAWRAGDVGEPVVLVHGYPDTHAVWDLVVDRLAGRFRCLTYDVRGAGASDGPQGRRGYRLSCLVSDLVAVLDGAFPAEAVHLVGHDWGSIQAWEAVVRERSDPRLRGRIASYTTISGPCLQHADAFVGSARGGSWWQRRQVIRQLRHSWYVYAFGVPVVPELFLRRYAGALMRRADRGRRRFADTLPSDAVNGLELYRANILAAGRASVPGGPRTSLPVQLVVPRRDAFITQPFVDNVGRFAQDLTRVEIEAGHWVQRSRPEELSSAIAAFATAHPATRH
jgi:pimeloyl-ACP methyl ester carboxylesterase